MGYTEFSSKPDLAKIQGDILSFWKDQEIFEKSLQKSKGEVIFYDGPPFPTGKPHHGTVLVSFIKDMIARYHTMQGFSVPRVWGWDCHGLPIENQAEKKLGVTDKSEIEKSIGIGLFNDTCHEIVAGNDDAWRAYVEQMARWVDYDGAYKTMNVTFMESVMWAFKQCYEKGLIYRDYRVAPYCCQCETSLSISDTRESDSTRPRQDRWVVAQFKSELEIDGMPVYFVAWTTTPWTLPSNMALALGSEIDYAYVRLQDRVIIACESTLHNFPKIFGEKPDIIKRSKGKELAGQRYSPLFPYFSNKKADGAFTIIEADFIDSNEGLGIVHIAPAFGEDDYWACKKALIPLVNPVDSKGRFMETVSDFFSEENPKTVIEWNSDIIRFMYANQLALDDGTIEHNYPHCWRCRNPLIYKALDAWYFSIESIKDRLLALNEEINWVPEAVKHGRFGKWLENARDWNISRNRYWSTPMPVWECEACHNRTVLGSIEEIYEKSGVKLTNLHRQYMDEVAFACDCGGTMRRIPEVLDCWFESGSVPFAQKHYPFENKEWFESHFPSDFIVEYTGQIRCWFYYLHVLSTALFDKPAFKNCLVHGTVLAKDGKKLSKSSQNYTDPMELMQTYGTDSFRLYMYQTNAMLVGDLLFDETGLKDALQQIILPFWNAHNFFTSYANIDGYHNNNAAAPQSDNLLDHWVLAKLYETGERITGQMDNYQINRYVENITSMLDGLTNWYIRRSRRRFWGVGLTEDKKSAYDTLYYTLVAISKLLAPVAPIISESIYKNLTADASVHLTSWPEIPQEFCNPGLLARMEMVQNIVYLARSVRNKNQVKNRQPLKSVHIAVSGKNLAEMVADFKNVIAEELNVKEVNFVDDVSEIADIKYFPNFEVIRSKYPKQMANIIKAVKAGAFESSDSFVKISIDAKVESFDPDVVYADYQAKDGLYIASDNGLVVSLDLTITKELKEEGIAREIVRNIQDARKQAGYEIMDRIIVSLDGFAPAAWGDYIASETLAQFGTVETPDISITLTDDGEKDIIIKIKAVDKA
ncbi:MAG: isoleucine--tRNA ligase [Lachnospiraceae bacterium]|nr:isoleucine--tRNA ligase [Lachnospiraceae bacterium]